MRSATILIAHPLSLAMTPDERTFFQALGARVAQARKDADLTQVQLAERLGIPQPQLASYEVGRPPQTRRPGARGPGRPAPRHRPDHRLTRRRRSAATSQRPPQGSALSRTYGGAV